MAGRPGACCRSGSLTSEASRRAPDHAHVWRWRGYRSALARDVDAAASEWNKAMSLDPSLREELEPELAGLKRRGK